ASLGASVVHASTQAWSAHWFTQSTRDAQSGSSMHAVTASPHALPSNCSQTKQLSGPGHASQSVPPKHASGTGVHAPSTHSSPSAQLSASTHASAPEEESPLGSPDVEPVVVPFIGSPLVESSALESSPLGSSSVGSTPVVAPVGSA